MYESPSDNRKDSRTSVHLTLWIDQVPVGPHFDMRRHKTSQLKHLMNVDQPKAKAC